MVDRPSKSTDADEMYNQDPTKDTGYWTKELNVLIHCIVASQVACFPLSR